jgi:exopolyphosphatase/guanosine-5'-triphosphate,3'-diphosphate pyrophosphatase
MQIAVLDLGSTTFHLQHFAVDGDGRFHTALDEKRSTCLGAKVFADGFIGAASWLDSLRAVAELLELSRSARTDQRAIVATSAIRSASNGPELMREIERRHHLPVRLLAPEDEAGLAYLGHSTSPVVGGRRVAIVDLGGGSVEIAVGEGMRCLYVASLPLGALRLRRPAHEAFDAEQARALRQVVRAGMADSLRAVRELSPELVVFGSGSARAARRLLLRGACNPGKTGPIETAAFSCQLENLLGASAPQLMALGVEPTRADSVLVSATIMVQMLSSLDVVGAVVSDKGLRDGVALELYRERAALPRAIRARVAFA